VDDFLTFTIFGIVTGAIYAIAASGLVVTYTTSGIFNFAHGAVGMLAAFTYWQLSVDWGWPTPVAMAVVLFVLAPGFGALIERTMIRSLEGTSETTKLVVSVGLLAALIGLAQVIWDTEGRRVDWLFGATNGVDVFDVFVNYHRLFTLGAAAAVALFLWLFLNRTRTGVSMRAVVDNRGLAQLNGVRPNRASLLSWAIGFSLAALAGILIAPVLQLRVIVLTFLVVNAYAAAMVGRLRSLPLTFVGAIGLGLLESYLIGWLDPNRFEVLEPIASWLDVLPAAIPTVALFVVLLVLPQTKARGLSTARLRETLARPTWRGTIIAVAVLLVGVGVLSVVLEGDPTNLSHLGRALALAMIVLSLVPLTGYGGQISLCQMGFAGIGAAVVSHWQIGGGAEDVLGLIAAFVITGMVGAIVALPALRLSGIYLALATFAFGVFLREVVFEHEITYQGAAIDVERFSLFGLSVESDGAYAVFLAVMFAVVAVGMVALRRGPFGRRLQAMKDSPAACATLGIDLTRTKLQVFALSAGIAGLGGALLAGQRTSISPDSFDPINSLVTLLMGVAGGLGMVSGAFVGGLLFASLEFWTSIVPDSMQDFVRNLMLLTPGIVGISLGRNPNGMVALVLKAISRGRETAEEREVPGQAAEHEPAFDLETLGLDRPIRPEDIDAIDARLDLGTVTARWSRDGAAAVAEPVG
jgi:branched-chain amino acid transport system permease protein